MICTSMRKNLPAKLPLDHIITNSIAKVKNVNVIPCPEVSDHDAPCITLSTKFAPFEPRYKIIRNMKNFRQ